MSQSLESSSLTTIVPIMKFDCSGLENNSQILVRKRTNEIHDLICRTASNIIEIGNKLREIKRILGHGHFGNWVQNEFNWSVATATKMMQASRQFKNVNFTNLNFSPSAIYLLAAPSTPTEARQEALAKAKQGETISYALAKCIVNSYKSSTPPSISTKNAIRSTKHQITQSIASSNQLLDIISLEPQFFERLCNVSSLLDSKVEPSFFQEYLLREWLRLKREKKYLSLVLCKINHLAFEEGEVSQIQRETLSEMVAQGISQSLNRPTDVFTEYQPGQFILLLSNTPPDGVGFVIKAIQTNLNYKQRKLLNSHENSMSPLTVSFKMSSSIPHPEHTLSKLLATLSN